MQEIIQAVLLLEINGVQLYEMPGANGLNIYELRYADYLGKSQRTIYFDYYIAEAQFVHCVEEEDYR